MLPTYFAASVFEVPSTGDDEAADAIGLAGAGGASGAVGAEGAGGGAGGVAQACEASEHDRAHVVSVCGIGARFARCSPLRGSPLLSG